MDFGDVGDIINTIITSVMNDPLFIFTTIWTMIGAIVKTTGFAPFRFFGNIAMAFMPMIMFLLYFFGRIPEEIVQLFGDFEWFGRIFYLLITTMLIVIILSAWNLFSGLQMVIG